MSEMSEVLETRRGMVPQQAEFLGQLVVSNDLGVSFKETEGLNYLTTPFDVYRTSLPNSDRFDLVSHHEPLNGDQLQSFLYEIAPSVSFIKSPESSYGIVEDWYIVDPQKFRKSNDVANLVRMHQVLGESWRQFVDSSPAFTAVLEDARVPGFSNVSNADLRSGDMLSPGDLLGDLNRLGVTSLDALIDLLHACGVKDAQRVIFESIGVVKTAKRKHKYKHRSPVSLHSIPELRRRYNSWGEALKSKVISVALASLEFDEGPFLDLNAHDYYEVLEIDDGSKYNILRFVLADGETLKRAYEDRSKRRLNNFSAEYLSFTRRSQVNATVLLGPTIQRVENGPTMSPLLTWTRNKDGERQLEVERDYRAAPKNYIDGVLGAMAIAYCEPQVRENWPKSMTIDNKKQNIGEAQVPVLTLMKRKDLMGTDFVAAAESLA